MEKTFTVAYELLKLCIHYDFKNAADTDITFVRYDRDPEQLDIISRNAHTLAMNLKYSSSDFPFDDFNDFITQEHNDRIDYFKSRI